MFCEGMLVLTLLPLSLSPSLLPPHLVISSVNTQSQKDLDAEEQGGEEALRGLLLWHVVEGNCSMRCLLSNSLDRASGEIVTLLLAQVVLGGVLVGWVV